MAGDLNLLVDLSTQQAAQQVEKLFNEFKSGSKEAGDQLNRLLKGSVEKKVRIRLEKDTAGIKQVKAELVEVQSAVDGITKAYNRANKTQPGSLTNLRQQVNEAKQARDAIALFSREVDLLNRKQILSGNLSPAFAAAQQNVTDLTGKLKNLELATSSTFDRFKASLGVDQFLAFGRGVQDLVTIFQSLGIAISALTAPINQAATALARLQGLELAFKAIGAGSGGASIALAESSRIALGLGVSLDTVRNGFQKLSPVILNSGGQLSDVSAILEALSSRFAAFGLNADESRRVLNGVVQAFAKGKLQAEELTQQISEADPAFKTDLARAIFIAKDSLKEFGIESDGTVANLEGLVKQGKLTSEVLIKVLPGLSKSGVLFGKLGTTALDAVASLGKAGTTITQVRTQIDNLNQLSFERLAKTFEPVIKSFLDIQAAFTDFITKVSKIEVIQSLAAALARVTQAVSNLTQFILNGIEGLIRFADAVGKVFNAIGRILGPIADLVSGLANAPGLIEAIGLLLLAKLVKPAKEAVSSVLSLTKVLNDFGQTGSIKISLTDDITKEFKDAANTIKQTFNPDDISRGIDDGTKKLNTIASERLQDLRKKFRAAANDLETPISIPEPASPAKLGISAKVLREVKDSKTSLSELFQLRGELEKDLSNIFDDNKRRQLFSENALNQIDAANVKLNELGGRIKDLESGPEVDIKSLQAARKEAATLLGKIAELEDAVATGFTPEVDTRQVRALEKGLTSVEKQILNLQKYRNINLKALVDDTDVLRTIRDTDGLRALYDKKLELEAIVNTQVDAEGALRELEDVKRTIRAVGKVDIPITANASGAIDDIALSKKEIAKITDNLILSEDQYYQSLTRQQAALRQNVEFERQRLDAARQGGDIQGIDPSVARTAYEQQGKALDSVNAKIDQYVSTLRESYAAGSGAAEIADQYTQRVLTQDQALSALSSQQERFTTIQTATSNAVNATKDKVLVLESALAKAKQTAASTSFGSKAAEEARATIASLTSQLSTARQQLGQLGIVSQSVADELSALGSVQKGISDAEFRFGEKLKAGFAPVGGLLNGFSQSIQSTITSAQSQFTKLGDGIKKTFSGGISGSVNNLKGLIGDIGKSAANAGSSIKSGIGNALNNLGTQLANVGKIDVGKTLKNSFDAAKASVSTFAKDAQRNIGTFSADTIKNLGKIGTNITGAFSNIKAGVKGIITSIGPELAIFATIATLTASYNEATKKTKAISEDTASSVKILADQSTGLKESLAGLNQQVAASNVTKLGQEYNGLQKILLTLGNALLSVQKAFEGLFNFVDSAAPKVGAVSNEFDRLARQLLVIGGFAAAGAAIGSIVPAIGTLAGALVGTGVGAFVAITGATEDWKVALGESKKELDALVQSAATRVAALKDLTKQLNEAKAQAAKIDSTATGPAQGQAKALFDTQGIAAYAEANKQLETIRANILGITQARDAANAVVLKEKTLIEQISAIEKKRIGVSNYSTEGKKLNAEYTRLNEELKKSQAQFGGSKEAVAQYNTALAQLKLQEAAAAAESKKIAETLGLTEAELKKIAKTSFTGVEEEIKNLEKAVKALNFDKSAEIIATSQKIGTLKADLEALDQISKKAELAAYFQRTTELIANGRLSSSLQNVNNLVANLNNQIALLDFTKAEDLTRLDELATKMGRLSAIIEVVEARVENNKLAGYIEQIKLGLANDEIPRSLQTIDNLVKALEQRTMLLDINSPELPEVIADMLQAKQELDYLNGKKASITLELIQEGLANGSLVNTLSLIDQQIEALNQKKLSLPVNSESYVQVIDQIKEITRQRQLSEQTTDDLLERKFNIQKERIDALASLEKAKSDARIALIDREIDKVKTYYDEQIKALEKQKGPAETQLEAVKLAELQQKARSGGREGLEAQAELERLDREKKIAQLKEESEKKVAELEKQKKAEQNAILDKEIAVAEKRLELEEKITQLRLKSLGAEEADIDAVLAQRAGQSGNKAGTAYGQAFAQASEMVIREAKPNEQDPASKVQFNYDNSQVLAAKDQVIAKEGEYQAKLTETNALRDQFNSAQPNTDQSIIVDQLLAKERELATLQAEQYTAEEQYNQVLRDTATITGEINVSNENLTGTIQEVSAATQETSAAANETAASFYDVNAAVAGTAEGLGQTSQAAGDLTNSVGDTADSTQKIGEGVEKAKGNFDDLNNAIVDTDGNIQGTNASFEAAAAKVNDGLVPALEKVPATLDTIQSKMNEIFDREYTVNVTLNVQKQGVWTGGPVTRGTAYTVNELGQEGFMNRFGKISPIQKPRWGTWRPPSDGFVIPADIYSQLRTDGVKPPKSSVSHSSPSVSGGRRDNGTKELARAFAAIGQGLAKNNDNGLDELSKVQAYQAKEIGKLSRAVQELSEKDWNVKVGVRNSGNMNSLRLSTYRI
jgi:tape measure domain-containing protein